MADPACLDDQITEDFFSKSNIMIIMRGLPGSGKTTLATRIKEKLKDSVILSADDFFMTRSGKYEFQREKLSAAHRDCQNKARKACEAGKKIIIIDNTNIEKSEMDNYLQLSSKHKYVEVIYIPQTEWRSDCKELARRSPHNVPLATIERRMEKFVSMTPLYYGWFINQSDSNMILDTARKYFRLCEDRLVAFRVYLEKHHNHDGPFWNLYRWEEVTKNILHCTSFSIVGRRKEEIDRYEKSEEVTQAIGKACTLSIVGFFATPRTIGARVQLSQQQQVVWKPPSGISEGAAHVTLGYVKKVEPVQTGLDLVDITKCEHEELKKNESTRETTFDAGVFRQYGEGRCYMYLNHPIDINTLFTGKYSDSR